MEGREQKAALAESKEKEREEHKEVELQNVGGRPKEEKGNRRSSVSGGFELLEEKEEKEELLPDSPISLRAKSDKGQQIPEQKNPSNLLSRARDELSKRTGGLIDNTAKKQQKAAQRQEERTESFLLEAVKASGGKDPYKLARQVVDNENMDRGEKTKILKDILGQTNKMQEELADRANERRALKGDDAERLSELRVEMGKDLAITGVGALALPGALMGTQIAAANIALATVGQFVMPLFAAVAAGAVLYGICSLVNNIKEQIFGGVDDVGMSEKYIKAQSAAEQAILVKEAFDKAAAKRDQASAVNINGNEVTPQDDLGSEKLSRVADEERGSGKEAAELLQSQNQGKPVEKVKVREAISPPHAKASAKAEQNREV